MLIFVYEFLTGGGLFDCDTGLPPGSLLDEGRAMVEAIASDLTKMQEIQVVILQDDRLPGRPMADDLTVRSVSNSRQATEVFCELARYADGVIVIAPEFDEHLASYCQMVLDCKGRLLSPSIELVQLAANKQATVEHLAKHDIAVPDGQRLPGGDLMSVKLGDWFPAVLKPLQGAGSQNIRLIRDRDAMPDSLEEPSRLERFCPGQPVSVAALCGPRGNHILPASAQRLSNDGTFAYQGGLLPLADSLATRAERLARRAIATLPDPLGYLGVDLILGPEINGRDDVVIEINPRLTTSYVGLRALSKNNLATAMLNIARGVEVEWSWHDGSVQFTTNGAIRFSPMSSGGNDSSSDDCCLLRE